MLYGSFSMRMPCIVRIPACCNVGCGTEAKYNIPGEPHGAYCGQHKLKDMERVNTRRCSADGCDKRASFNTAGAPLLLRPHTVPCSCSDALGTASLDVLIRMSYLIACSMELQETMFIIFRGKRLPVLPVWLCMQYLQRKKVNES